MSKLHPLIHLPFILLLTIEIWPATGCNQDQFSDSNGICIQCSWCAEVSAVDPLRRLHMESMCRNYAASCGRRDVTVATPPEHRGDQRHQNEIERVTTSPGVSSSSSSSSSWVLGDNSTSVSNSTTTTDWVRVMQEASGPPTWTWIAAALLVGSCLSVFAVVKYRSGKTGGDKQHDVENQAPRTSQSSEENPMIEGPQQVDVNHRISTSSVNSILLAQRQMHRLVNIGDSSET